MAVSQSHPPDDKISYAEVPDYLSSLPNEVLVKIISLLPETQDRIKLRYVSRRLQKISETPSLWREVLWRDCNSCEKERLHNIMKSYGIHIRQLSFSQHLIHPRTLPIVSQTTMKLIKVPEMAKMLRYCSNLTHLSLPVLDHSKSLNGGGDRPDDQLREAIQRMKYLEVLKVYCCSSYQPYLALKMALKELTVHTIIHSEEDVKGFQMWMMNGFNPPNLNVIVPNGNIYSPMIMLRKFLLGTWPKWNVRVPTGHTACVRLYSNYKVPLSLFQNAPVFQLRYGETVTLPYVRAANVGIDGKWLLLTDHDDGSKSVHKATLYLRPSHAMQSILHDHGQDNQLQLDNGVTNLTELDLSECNIDIKPIVSACPWLQRLNLTNIRSLRLEELQVIATCCCNLQGLNLMKIQTFDNNFCMNVWEILCSMKLTHLNMDSSLFGTKLRDVQKTRLVTLFKQYTTLQALELSNSMASGSQTYYDLLPHFPSLKYCRLVNQNSTYAEHILTTCKNLRLFCYYGIYGRQFSLSLAYNNLQQLCISSEHTDLNDNFMNTVSAHGGLIHVAFFVGSVTDHGIATLISNSPNLLTFGLREQKRSGDDYLKSLGATLQKKFNHRKLFTSGVFGLIRQMKDDGDEEGCPYVQVDENWEVDEWLKNTKLSSLWPREQFIELPTSPSYCFFYM